MRSKTSSVLVLGLLTGASGTLGVIAACSSDDTAAPAPTPDSGGHDVSNPMPDATPGCVDAGHTPLNPACSNASCTQQAGEPAMCINNACVKLKTTDCAEVYGDPTNDDAILVASLQTLHGSDGPTGQIRAATVKLAVDEINKAGGILNTDGCGRRPLVLLSCDDSNTAIDPQNPDAGKYSRTAAATHLTKDLHVPGIIGPQASSSVIDVFNNVTKDARTLIIPPASVAAEITSIAGGTQDGVRLIWRMAPDDSFQDQALISYTNQVIQQLGRSPIKIAIVARNDAYGQGNLNGIKAGLQLNGKPWTDPANANYVLDVSYDITKTVPISLVQQVVAFQPDIIFHFGLGEFSSQVIAPFEDINHGVYDGGVPPSDAGDGGATEAGPADAGSIGHDPIWMCASSAQRSDLLPVIAARPTLKTRILGTTPLIVTSLSQALVARYQAAFADAGTDLIFGQPQAYDALYMLAYGLTETKLAAGVPSSEDVIRGVAKVVTGSTPIDVGPSSLTAGLEQTRQGNAIKLNGASGPLNFDPTTGQLPGDYAIWCIRSTSAGAPKFENVTGLTWSYKSNTLNGTFNCPQ